MKSSRYNHFFEIEGGDTALAYNSYNGAMAEIEKENYTRILHLLVHPDHAESTQDNEFIQCLKEGGFLIADGVDQSAALRTKARRLRLEGAILTLTIAPTLACNFNCDYCYESHSGIRMSKETQQALLDFSDRYLTRAQGLRICWFGGEPTLCLSVINRLQNGLTELANKHQVDIIPGTIITNGFLLDADMAQHLKDLGISRAQITIDGPENVHDKRRTLRSGKGTFRRIVDNLSDTADILTINVRINVDKSNVDSTYEVIEFLQHRDILTKVKVHFAQVISSGAACADICDRCYGEEEFSHTLVNIYSRLFDNGIYRVDYPRVFAGASFCGALSEGYFVVSPTGHLFRCWEELSFDSSKSIGDIFSSSPDDHQRRNLDAYTAWDPFNMSECKECSVLPICMGGCPLHGMKNPQASRGICLPWKYNLRKMIELKYLCETREKVGQ
jgi:uncharacterized protein